MNKHFQELAQVVGRAGKTLDAAIHARGRRPHDQSDLGIVIPAGTLPATHALPTAQMTYLRFNLEVIMTNAKFSLGQIVSTPGALAALEQAGQSARHFLDLHASGAWGDLDREDRMANEQAIANEHDPQRRARVLSSYRTRNGAKLWIITEHDRSATTLLLPEDY